MAMTKPLSEQVRFTQNGTGAVERLASDKLREWVSVKDFGAVGDGVADDSDAIIAAMASGKGLLIGNSGDVFRITKELQATLTSDVAWFSNGAKILVDSVSSIRSAVRIALDGNSLTLHGELHIACDSLSFSGFYASNLNTLQTADVTVKGLRVSDCYRASTAFTGGDGIWVSGNLGKVSISDVRVSNVRMALGAGVMGSQGVCGITVSRDNTGGTAAKTIHIYDFFITGIYSEDPDYTFDQDGIRAFSNYTSPGTIVSDTSCFISSGKISNSRGRAVKIQSEWATVRDVMIVREGLYASVTTPEIDFQVGGGSVIDVQCLYKGEFPVRVVQMTLTRDATRVNPVAVTLRGIKVYQSGAGTGIVKFCRAYSEFTATCQVAMEDIYIQTTKTIDSMLEVESLSSSSRFHVNVARMMGRATQAVVYRSGSVAVPCYVTGIGIALTGASAPFVGSQVAGGMTSSLLGANVLVS